MNLFGLQINIRTKRERQLETELRNMQSAYGPSGWGQSWDNLFTGNGLVTRQKALSVPAVYAAVDIVSKTLASLPFGPYRKTASGSERAETHPLFLLETLEPSPYTTAFNFWRDLFADACFGKAVAKITFKGNGRAGQLERLDPDLTHPHFLDNGKMLWITQRNYGGRMQQEILMPYEVLHLRGISLDGYQGLDIPKQFSDSFGMSIDATKYGGSFFYNNAAIDGVVEFPGGLDPKSRQIIEDKIQRKHSGVQNAGGIMVLDAGAKYNKIGTSPQEAMLNETRMFQGYESCRIFGVPAHMINILDRSTFNNIEVMDNSFVRYCLTPWATQVEQECDVKLLTSDEKATRSVFHHLDLSGLMRGDMESRAKYEDTMLKNMVFTINDVRRMNNLNTVPWGDTPYAQAGITNVKKDGSIEVNQPQPDTAAGQTDTPNGQPQAGK